MKNEVFAELEEPIKDAKKRIITFRVKEQTFLLIESLAGRMGKKPNEWARDITKSEAVKEIQTTRGDQLLYEEMAKLRFTVGKALKLLAASELSMERWLQVLAEADQNGDKIAQQLLAKRRSSKWRSVQ